MAVNGGGKVLHIVMYPWFAMGHLTAFLHMSNKLAAKGHSVSFLIPTKTQSKLNLFNLHPSLISFIPIDVPPVDGLPYGAETTADVPFPLHTHLMTAMDRTETTVESILLDLKPELIFFDFSHWIPVLARRLGIKSVHYCTASPANIAYSLSPERDQGSPSKLNLEHPPLGFPPSAVKLHSFEATAVNSFEQSEYGSGVSFRSRVIASLSNCDAIAFKACKEMEGPFCDYLERQFRKPVLLSGPVIPETPTSNLDEKWNKWLGGFKKGSVVYCALGSQSNLNKHQFVELVLALERTGLPFFAALRPPTGNNSVVEVLPEGFIERVKGRGIVEGGWVQQQLILSHPSIGCFVTHCGSGSITEALVNDCQIVLLPLFGDQPVNARLMAGDLKVGVEVERRDGDDWFTGQSICNAVKLVMDENGEVAKEVRLNHAKWKEFLLSENLESSYTDEFITKLRDLLNSPVVVPSIHELVKQNITEIPNRYIRISDTSTASDLDHDSDSTVKYDIPVIDVEGLLSGESVLADTELEKLHSACRDWGFFQVVNHGISSLLIEKLKLEIHNLFELPVEERRQLQQKPGNPEGFGQQIEVSDDKILDWSDMFFITAQPTRMRNPQLFARIPLLLREALEAYSLGLKSLTIALLGKMAKALKMDSNEMDELFNDCLQRMKMNYYPPCPKPHQVLGQSPHTDAGALSIVLQLNETEGLQIRKDGKWVTVKPISGALLVNIGDMIEVLSNGAYQSIEHRVIINPTVERLSIATFHSMNADAEFGPAFSLIDPPCKPAIFRRETVKKYFQNLFAPKLNGKATGTNLDFMRIENGRGNQSG